MVQYRSVKPFTSARTGFCALFVVSYVVAYVAIIRFKVPQWVRRR